MKIYLAGAEQADSIVILKGMTNLDLFFSYYYLKNKNDDILREKFELVRHNKHFVVIDSGAHTFFAENADKIGFGGLVKKQKDKKNPNEYFQDYLQFIKKYYDFFDYYVELDIGELIGQEKVIEWRKILNDLGLGKKCIQVYHPNTGEDFDEILDNCQSRYIALEGDRADRNRLNYRKLIKKCYEKKVKVHGFAMVKNKVIKNIPFFSVDSSSWKAGVKYGNVVKFKEDSIKSIKRNRIFETSLAEGNGVLFKEKEERKQAYDINMLNSAKQFVKLENYITKLWEVRGIKW